MEDMLYQILPVAMFVNAALFMMSLRLALVPKRVKDE